MSGEQGTYVSRKLPGKADDLGAKYTSTGRGPSTSRSHGELYAVGPPKALTGIATISRRGVVLVLWCHCPLLLSARFCALTTSLLLLPSKRARAKGRVRLHTSVVGR